MCFLPLDKICALTHTHTDTQWLWGLWSGLHLGSFLTEFFTSLFDFYQSHVHSQFLGCVSLLPPHLSLKNASETRVTVGVGNHKGAGD